VTSEAAAFQGKGGRIGTAQQRVSTARKIDPSGYQKILQEKYIDSPALLPVRPPPTAQFSNEVEA